MDFHPTEGNCIIHLDVWLQEFESFSGIEFPLAAHHYARTASRCACGVGESFAPTLMRYVLFALMQRLVWSLPRRWRVLNALVDLCVVLLGVVFSWLNRGSFDAVTTIFAYFCLSSAIVFVVRRIERTWTGPSCTIFTFLYTIVCQFYVFDALVFTSLYGSLMVAAMKQISLAYDIQTWKKSGTGSVSHYLSVLAFLFNPATLLFGPFLTYGEFSAARENAAQFWRPDNWRSIISQLFFIGRLFAATFSFLILSHCFSEQWPYLIFGPASTFLNIFPLFPDVAVEFALGYAEAQSFRFNHYFVCYLADALCALAGIRFTAPGVASKTTTKWPAVEWPQSMNKVVMAWNLPMHNFLRNYVFRRTRDLLGRFASVVFTFGSSAFLHGFNFQLNAVLISLAVYGLAESELRGRLADRFSACVKSHKCRDDCGHHFGGRNIFVKMVNFAFTFLNIFHLAYLGSPFAASAEEAEVGYHWRHTLAVWSHWNFSSHIVAIVTFLLSRIV